MGRLRRAVRFVAARVGRPASGLCLAAILACAATPALPQAAACPPSLEFDQVAHCMGGIEDYERQAVLVGLLVRGGFFAAGEFSGVRVIFCGLPLSALGTAVDASLIYLDTRFRTAPPGEAAAILGHEMVHVRQYRRWGQAGFAAAYGQARARCACCVSARNAVEREAYAMENRVRSALRRLR